MMTRKKLGKIVQRKINTGFDEDYFFRITYQLEKGCKGVLISCWNRNNMLAANSLYLGPIRMLTEKMICDLVDEAYQKIFSSQPIRTSKINKEENENGKYKKERNTVQGW